MLIMANAQDYNPSNDFSEDESTQAAGRSTVSTAALDTEFANLSTSFNALNANVQMIQRDDGKFKDESIEPYALSEQTKALIATQGGNPRGTWLQNTDYDYKDVVQHNNIAQICIKEGTHNSGTLFTQSFWLPISGDGTSSANAAAAAASAANAATSEANAQASATTASNAASAAAASQASAASSATDSANSAAAAASSESNASSSAANAANSETSAANSETNAALSASQAAASLAAIQAGRFTSSNQSIVNGTTLTIPHGLGDQPFDYFCELICISSEEGFVAGDIIKATSGHTTTSSAIDYGAALKADGTNIYVIIGNQGFWVTDAVTHDRAQLNSANWEIRVKAWL